MTPGKRLAWSLFVGLLFGFGSELLLHLSEISMSLPILIGVAGFIGAMDRLGPFYTRKG